MKMEVKCVFFPSYSNASSFPDPKYTNFTALSLRDLTDIYLARFNLMHVR